jgi:hypothetical protein
MEGKSPGKEIISAKEEFDQATGGTQNGFLSEELVFEKWAEMLELFNDRPNLKSTLSSKPIFTEEGKLTVKIDNSLQDELIRSQKPKIVAWLRRELNNSNIDLVTEIRAQPSQKIAYTEGEKLEEMMKKNEDLILLKQKFQLDFDEL